MVQKRISHFWHFVGSGKIIRRVEFSLNTKFFTLFPNKIFPDEVYYNMNRLETTCELDII